MLCLSGQDGSTQVTAQVDATGVGKTFKAATVTKNGVKVCSMVPVSFDDLLNLRQLGAYED
jgi:hypothetical protein